MASRSAVSTNLIRFGDDFELDPRAYELRRSGQALKLERIPMELLLLLVEQRGQLVSREQIVERIWGKDVFLDTDNSINAAIRKIRQVLKDDPEQPRFVQTLTGRGYRFIAPVDDVGPSAVPSAEAPVAGSLIGKKISHYRILQVLGGGGMGVVYKAEDLKLGRRVALKFLPSELANDPKALDRMQREARAASALDHPNICAIYELGEHDGQPFLVMQLLEGQTLREWIESIPVFSELNRLSEIVSFGSQIAAGLDAAHGKGIIHRDIKPANIFITNRGEAKILDFGVAKFLGSEATEGSVGENESREQTEPSANPEPSLTQTGDSFGTPSYLSPEQVRHEELDARTDLFSFGLVLYEMTTGHKGFSGSSATGIQEAVLRLPIVPARQLQPDIPPKLESIISKAVEKERNDRYQTAADMREDLQTVKTEIEERARSSSGIHPASRIPEALSIPTDTDSTNRDKRQSISSKIRWKPWAVAALVATLSIFGAVYLSGRHANRLTAEDTIVLGDFANSTGDPIFDDTLKQALTVTLRQSPFLNILPEGKIAKTLKLMTREPTTALTTAVASEVCQRAGSKAYVAGAIGSLGTAYVVGLKAVNCHNGETLAQEQLTAGSKEQVLVSLGEAATKLRRQLGESLTTVQKFDVPLIEATTPSLEALRELSLGQKAWNTKGESEALPYMKRAVELDPNFASAYSNLGTVYENLQQHGLAAENFTKAYELRERVSERERFHILGHYYASVTGELEKAIPTYEQWEREYPSDATPHTNVGNIFLYLGQNENSLAEHKEALRVESNGVLIYENLALSYASLNRFDEATATVNQAFSRHLDDAGLHMTIQQIAFLSGDTKTTQQQFDWGMGKPGVEDIFMAIQADVEAAGGHIRKAREFSRRATESAAQSGSKETAAFWQSLGALHETDIDDPKEAAKQADAALALARNRDTLILAALSFARAGKADRARTIADQLDHESPLDTLVQSYWLPTIRAAIHVSRHDGYGAMQALQPALPYELGSPQPIATLYPVYLRGQALLLSHQGAAAAVEFEKILAHRPLATFAVGNLANLELGRAYAMSGETTKAARAYEDFFSLWKDADPNTPILREAKAEFATLNPVSRIP
jgi:serine/threonine protein kinase/tetratricopeptide (TPR) repeat protein